MDLNSVTLVSGSSEYKIFTNRKVRHDAAKTNEHLRIRGHIVLHFEIIEYVEVGE